MKIGNRVLYVARMGSDTFEICGEIVAFEEVEWTQSGIEVGVQFTDSKSGETWVQYIDPTRLEVVNE